MMDKRVLIVIGIVLFATFTLAAIVKPIDFRSIDFSSKAIDCTQGATKTVNGEFVADVICVSYEQLNGGSWQETVKVVPIQPYSVNEYLACMNELGFTQEECNALVTQNFLGDVDSWKESERLALTSLQDSKLDSLNLTAFNIPVADLDK